MAAVLDKLYEELKTVPITMMFMAGIYVCVAILWNDHVSKSDFVDLRSQMIGVQYTLRSDHADSRLHSIEQELFNLKQHVLDERTKGHSVDEIYDRRIDTLTNEREEILREITQLNTKARSLLP